MRWSVGGVVKRLEVGLKLHPEKTCVVSLGDGRQRFDFSGIPVSEGGVLAMARESVPAVLAESSSDADDP